jgi:hypothetical protein
MPKTIIESEVELRTPIILKNKNGGLVNAVLVEKELVPHESNIRWNVEEQGWVDICGGCDIEWCEGGEYDDDNIWHCKDCVYSSEDEVDECYGKHCSMTANDTPLKMVIGWNREYCLDGMRFKEHLHCGYCEKQNCYADCESCSVNYKLTDMKLCRDWGSEWGHHMFCIACVKSIESHINDY